MRWDGLTFSFVGDIPKRSANFQIAAGSNVGRASFGGCSSATHNDDDDDDYQTEEIHFVPWHYLIAYSTSIHHAPRSSFS
jgi:hypothetical protein